ncbi:acyltransferase family protein [Novosphingobium gossypii]|uniref:acyltransferase family protein n=1 Tax=Novosphingobium gossypii TaxID=1604774 RepID=UPI003D22D53A
MARNLSVFLDLLRLAAAVMVFVAHGGAVYGMDLPPMIGHSAKEGVAIFFVLSGLVIAFVTDQKEHDWKNFARARAVRLYSVVPVAIAVLCLCYAIGAPIAPDLYGLGAGYPNAGAVGNVPDALAILRYLTFTNEIWFDRAMISTGAPFWSLGFEAAYYVAFAILRHARGGWRWGFGALWLLAVGPRIVLVFPLWLIGVGTWSLIRKDVRIPGWIASLALVVIGLAALAWRRWVAAAAVPLFEWGAPDVLAASMGYYLVLCLLLATAIAVFAAGTPKMELWPSWLQCSVRYCAGASFTLYIMHLPVMVLIAAMWPASCTSWVAGTVAMAMTMGIIFILAELGERRKAQFERIFPLP